MTHKVHPKVREALDATGLPWHIEEGSKHNKVRLNGRFVLILAKGGRTGEDKHPRLLKNDIANVRRAAKELKAAQ